MRIILSRKGFDQSSGGYASPIFPGGEMRSLPIPRPDEPFRTYSQIMMGSQSLSLGPIVRDLTGGKISPDCYTHLDPDLTCESIPREPGWRPIFGQAGQAQTHLKNQRVGEGDVFLFYGWFRCVEQVDGRYRYVQGAPDLHVIYGWLQVERSVPVYPAHRAKIPTWARSHQHCIRARHRAGSSGLSENDTIYISTQKVELPGRVKLDKPGGGAFKRYNKGLQLTAPGKTRSIWQLPAWFYPGGERPALSCHSDPRRWTIEHDRALLKT